MNDRHCSGFSALLLVVFVFMTACSSEPAPSKPAENTTGPWEARSDNKLYEIVLRPAQGVPVIGAFQEWRIVVTDANGAGVFPATIKMSGGMPEHGHGLPTQPQVTEHLGNGEYRIEGARFNMAGNWLLNFQIDSARGGDLAELSIDMAF